MTKLFDSLSLIDFTGRALLATTFVTLVLGVGFNLFLRARYKRLAEDLKENGAGSRRFLHEVLNDITRAAENTLRTSPDPNVQGIIEDCFQTGLKPLLLAERFVRATTGLVIILGLLGTFYGLTSSIGRLVELIGGDAGSVAAVTGSVTSGLTQALSGMAVAFSNSLVGVGSAVVLTVLGILSNPTDQRVALMIGIEAHLDRRLSDRALASSVVNVPGPSPSDGKSDTLRRTVSDFSASVERLEGAVARFDSALQAFSASSRDFSEFNAHLKDNIQRMSLNFGDLSDVLKTQLVTLKRQNGQ